MSVLPAMERGSRARRSEPPGKHRRGLALFALVVASAAFGTLVGVAVFHQAREARVAASVETAGALLALTSSYVGAYSRVIGEHPELDAPVPAAFRAMAAKSFNRAQSGTSRMTALMVGLPGREIATPPLDAAMAATLERMSREGAGAPVTALMSIGDEPVVRTVFPSIAGGPSCVACHNRLQPGGPRWAQGDLIGGYVVQSGVGPELRAARRYAAIMGALSGLVPLLAIVLWLYYRALRRQSTHLRTLAATDPLTGCLNRRALLERYAAFAATGLPGTVLMLDIDHFKRINDEHGHEAGDAVLVGFAREMRSQLREGDVLARTGGEEFVVLAPGADVLAARSLAYRLCASAAAHPVDHSPLPIRFTVSVGGLQVGDGSAPLETVMARADAYLYQAKRLGRNRVLLPRAMELAC